MSDRTTMNGKPVYEIPAKSVINWDSGFKHKLLCDGPTFSTGSACAYSCSFCYVPALMLKSPHTKGIKEPFEDVVIRRNGAIDAIKNQLLSPKGRALSRQKLVVYSSPLVDVAANMDLVKETVEACKLILTLTKWDIRLLSKSNLLPKVAQILSEATIDIGNIETGVVTRCNLARNAKERIIYGVSTGTLDDRLAKAFEQGTPLVSKRIESLHWLQDNGYRTFGMICPSLPQRDYVAFAEEMYLAIRGDRCEHVWAEVINVRGDSMVRTYNALREASFIWESMELVRVSEHKDAWEKYARDTFIAHANLYPVGKLRFLQYVTKDTREWWTARKFHGAIIL